MKFFLSLVVIISYSVSYTQSIIKGTVLDDRKNPLTGVNIFVRGTIDGTSSDELGHFSFKTKTTGEAIIICKHIAMNDVEIRLTIQNGTNEISVMMFEKQADLEEVIISAGAFSLSDRKRATVLNTMDVETTPGADGDITTSLQTLPSTQQVGESGRLFVRGGSGDESKITIDGLDVPNPYYAGVPDVAQRNRFSPHLFKGIVFNAGGYSAQYGEALSSVLSLETKDHPSKASTVISIIPYGGQIGHDFLSKDEKTSGGFDVAYSNFKPFYSLIPQRVEWLKAPESAMLSGTFRKNFSNGGMLKWYGYGNLMQQVVNQPNTEEYGKKYAYHSENANAVSVLTYTQNISEKWKMYAGYGFNFNEDNISEVLKMSHLATFQHQFRFSSFGKISDRFQLETGTEAFFFHSEQKKKATPYFYDYLTAIWAEGDIKLGRDFLLRTGLRSEYDDAMHRAVFLPRISLGYRTGKHHQLTVSVGEYSQKPSFSFLKENPKLTFAKAIHYIGNFQYSENGQFFRLETYYKKYSNLLKFNNLSSVENTGYGFAWGVDFFWRDTKTIKGFDYWLAYTWLSTERNYLNFPIQAMPTYATPHTAHVVAKYFIEDWGVFVGGSYSVSSGRPYYNPLNTSFLADRTPIYQNANINLAFLRKWGKTFHTVVFAINNLTGREHIFGYRFSPDGNYRLAVTPPYNRSFMVGWFISIGQDRSEEFLEQLP